MTQQIDVKLTHRIETGKLQIGNDFPGYYIRSEDAKWLYDALNALRGEIFDLPFSPHQIRMITEFMDELRKV